ncbi:MAG: tRNA (adenosine(37)-N6)-dimethylallyltransferase MiaA [Acidiferrobacterales bacterium]
MKHSTKPNVVFLMGPTAAGKTNTAIYLSQHLSLDLISVDSSLVYRGMDIGTAKPSQAELKIAPHKLISIREPTAPYSAADFCTDATREINQILARGRIPLLVGGTMFYFKALEYGLSDLPEADPEIRSQISVEAHELGWPVMHEKLAAADPVTASKIDPNDAQRIQRALEVLIISGDAPSKIMMNPAEFKYNPIKLALVPSDRKQLHQRIEQRFESMLVQGLVQEVEKILKLEGIDPSLPAMRMVGYRQVGKYLTGEISYSDMKERAIAATRQLAKRQLTWIRHYEGIESFDCLDANVAEQCLRYLQEQLEIQARK